MKVAETWEGGVGGRIEQIRKRTHRHGQQCGDCGGEEVGVVEEGTGRNGKEKKKAKNEKIESC